MRGTHSFLINEENVEFSIDSETCFNPLVLNIRQGGQSIQLHLTNEQLAEIEYVSRTYLDGIRYTETPDQQAILNDELAVSIKEEIA